MEGRKVFSLSCILSFAVLARSSPSIPVSDQSQTSGTRHLVRESADNHRAHGDLALIGGDHRVWLKKGKPARVEPWPFRGVEMWPSEAPVAAGGAISSPYYCPHSPSPAGYQLPMYLLKNKFALGQKPLKHHYIPSLTTGTPNAATPLLGGI